MVFAKLQRIWREEPTLTEDDLARIPIPVLVTAGDDDVVRHAHTVALYEALPHGQLAVIPGASHAVFLERPGLLDRLILDFLGGAGRSPDDRARPSASGIAGLESRPASAAIVPAGAAIVPTVRR